MMILAGDLILKHSKIMEWKKLHINAFLNDFFTGKTQGSVSRGELYNDDPVTMDARFCVNNCIDVWNWTALKEDNAEKLEEAVR